MVNNKVNAANILRLYAWDLLRSNEVLDYVVVDGEALVPVIPVDDEPKFRESGEPYIIYGWSESEENDLREIERGSIAFRIIASDSNQLNYISNVLSRGFKGEDDSADSVNQWSTNHFDGALIGIRFTWVKTTMVESADASDSEGGEVESSIVVGYRYISQQQVKIYRNGSWS